MKRRDETDPGARMQGLETEREARRDRLSSNLDELSGRMTFANLFSEAKEAVLKQVDRAVDDAVQLGQEMVSDSLDWVRDNRTLVAGGTATALVAAGLVWAATRRRTVPLYAAYDQEDFPMTDENDPSSTNGGGTWGKVRNEAGVLGDRAGEAYYSVRSKAAELSDTARERARDAADLARERAHEAAEAARDAAERAREAAGDAGRWAARQPQENPASVVLGAMAFGVLVGLLLPSGNRARS